MQTAGKVPARTNAPEPPPRSGPGRAAGPRYPGSFPFDYREFTRSGAAANYVLPMTTQAIASGPSARGSVLRCGNLEIRSGALQALAQGRPIALTGREFQVLLALAERRNRVVPRAELYELVWRRRMAYRDRSVDVFVRKLRLKLSEASPNWTYIHTHFGIGYRFAPERLRRPPALPRTASAKA
jgi:DNA-binding response OmpR family regulator